MKTILLALLFSASAYAQQYSWTTLTSPPATTGRYDDVFFLNENLGWVVRGGNGAVYKTVNGGTTWNEQMVPGSSGQYFRNIEFLNENIGFLGTLNNSFYKTINGGSTWEKVSNISPYPQAICGLDTVGESTIYGCGAWFSPAYIIKSTDSGTTWVYKDMSAYANALVEIQFIDENVGFVGGNDQNGAVLLKTTDGGENWTKIYSNNVPNDYVWKIQIFPDHQTIFCSIESEVVSQGKLAKSFDGGINWEVKLFPDHYVQAVGFVSKTHGWMGGHYSGFMETFDGGDTWINNNLGGSLNRIYFVNNTVAYASGNEIYKMTHNLGVSNTKENDKERKLRVEAVPNPVKDRLLLTVFYEHSDHIIISLYDATGKFIGTIVKDDISLAGKKEYTVKFDYPAGQYFIDIHSNLGRQSIKIIKE